MPVYEYYCPKCQVKFEELRPMSRADAPASCPSGHRNASRTLSMFAAVPRVNTGEGSVATMPSGGGCACGGGGCGCGH
jgi:putative FmdB family regulatory protein